MELSDCRHFWIHTVLYLRCLYFRPTVEISAVRELNNGKIWQEHEWKNMGVFCNVFSLNKRREEM